MKPIYRIFMFFLISSIGIVLAGCDDDDDSLSVSTLAVTPTSVATLPVGDTQQFTAIATNTDTSTQDVTSIATWQTSDSAVVTIEPGGLAVTRATGTAEISAVYGVFSNSVTMTVDEAAPPPPTDTTDYTPENVCDAEFCATDDALSQTCSTFLAACLAASPANEEECVGGALVICQNPDEDAGSVCTYGRCSTDTTLQQQCQIFMAGCINESANEEGCVGAMLFFCRPEE